jgi:uncharacterized protein (TIGR02145 family)
MKKLIIVFALTSALFSYENKILAQNLGKPGPNITDVEGNLYKTVTIGTQTWMAENLKVSKYSDGTPIPNITDNTQWEKNNIGAWAYYNNDTTYNVKYGKLYTWNSVSKIVNNGKNVCPTGWHVPTNTEWIVLIDYLGGADFAGGKMKEVGTTNWKSKNKNATNISLFSALPGGYRSSSGDFSRIGNNGFWWSSTERESSFAFHYFLYKANDNVYSSNASMKYGLSIRCLKD